LLAAGSSSRLGTPKQLLVFNDTSLLGQALMAAKNGGADKVVLVLGAGGAEIAQRIETGEVEIFYNAEWEEGIASSIRNGLKHLLKLEPGIEGALFIACDQPYVTADTLTKLITMAETSGERIGASGYGDTVGIPAFFHKDLFSELLLLKGDTGAKKIMLDNNSRLAVVDFPRGKIDIDTVADYEQLTRTN
jgi:molybdenum cofactor cytidylyltransferase